MKDDLGQDIITWLHRTPVQTFILCPLVVIAFELARHGGRPVIVPWGVPLLVWGYAQYLLVGNYRLPLAGGSAGMTTPPDHVIDTGPYAYTRNPMYLGHLIFMAGLALTFWSWFALFLFAVRAVWFHSRVLHDEERLQEIFGAEYEAYRARVKRWIPWVF